MNIKIGHTTLVSFQFLNHKHYIVFCKANSSASSRLNICTELDHQRFNGLVEGWKCKRPIPICRLFFKINLLMDIAALCLTNFIDWRYIHSLVGIFDPTCELLPPWTKELYLCTVAPLSSLWPPSPLPKLNVLLIQTVCVWGGGEGGGELCCVDQGGY